MTEWRLLVLWCRSPKCVVIFSTVITHALKNTLVWMKSDAKLKTLTTGLYSNVNDRVRVSFCYAIRQNSVFLPFVVHFLTESIHIFYLKYSAVIKGDGTVPKAVNLVADGFGYTNVKGIKIIEERSHN